MVMLAFPFTLEEHAFYIQSTISVGNLALKKYLIKPISSIRAVLFNSKSFICVILKKRYLFKNRDILKAVILVFMAFL